MQEYCIIRSVFQSTPSKRKETFSLDDTTRLNFVSIHSFQAEGDVELRHVLIAAKGVSIHSFQAEGDRLCC